MLDLKGYMGKLQIIRYALKTKLLYCILRTLFQIEKQSDNMEISPWILFKEQGMDISNGNNHGSPSVVPIASFERDIEKWSRYVVQKKLFFLFFNLALHH